MDKLVTFTGQIVITVDDEEDTLPEAERVLGEFLYTYDIESVRTY